MVAAGVAETCPDSAQPGVDCRFLRLLPLSGSDLLPAMDEGGFVIDYIHARG